MQIFCKKNLQSIKKNQKHIDNDQFKLKKNIKTKQYIDWK